MKLIVDFGPIHGNAYTLAAALVYGPITNTNTIFSSHIGVSSDLTLTLPVSDSVLYILSK